VAPRTLPIHHAPDRHRQPFRLETLDERTEPSFAAFQKLPRESEGRHDRQGRRNRAPAAFIGEHDRVSMRAGRMSGHKGEKRSAHARHVPRDKQGCFTANPFESRQRTREGSFVCDRVAHE